MYSLNQIKTHPLFPFDDFLTNDVSFLMVELYWAELLKSTLGNVAGRWVPLRSAARDGNPILSVFCPSSKRGLRIVQKYNEKGKVPYPTSKGDGTYYGLQPWCTMSLDPDGRRELLTLVLFSDCAALSEEEGRALMYAHCVTMVPVDEIEALVLDYERRVGMPE